MKPCLAIDPAALAFPAVCNSEAEVESAIDLVCEIARRIRLDPQCHYALLEDTSTYLAAAGLFPAPASIHETLHKFGLAHVYDPEDIRRSVNDILSRASILEDLSGIAFFVPLTGTTNPDVLKDRTGQLAECLLLTLLHACLLSGRIGNPLVAVVIGGKFESNAIGIEADLSDIEPPLPGLVTEQRIKETIRLVVDITSYLENLPPEELWAAAETAEEFSFAVALSARKILRENGIVNAHEACERFVCGANFVDSLQQWEADGKRRHASTTLQACARIVARAPKYDINDFDGAKRDDCTGAHRTHITKHHEAMRLMFWRKNDGSIEFANIGSKNELKIF